MDKLKVGIVCDDYKAKFFAKKLTSAGYSFVKMPRTPTPNTFTFAIETENSLQLQKLITQINADFFDKKKHAH